METPAPPQTENPPGLSVCPRLLRDRHSGHPHLHRQSSGNLHRQQEYCDLVLCGDQPGRELTFDVFSSLSKTDENVQVIIACIPTYGPLFKSFASTVTSYRNRDTSRTYALGSVRQGTGTGSAIARKRSNFEPIYESEGRPVTDIQSGTLTNDGDSEVHILSEAENMKVYVTSEFTVKSGVAH